MTSLIKQNSNINLYWWEGFYGFQNTFKRLCKGKKPFIQNFGDLLSPFIISLLTEQKPNHCIGPQKLLALGSIFFALRDKDTVWGSGFLNAKHIQYALSCKEVKYLAVRGPETRNLLLQHHIACPETYGDPAILLPQLITNDIKKKYPVGIVPHFSQYAFFKKTIANKKIINVENHFSEVIRDILSCEIILSTSLHGLIIAEAYGIPALLLVVDKPLHGDLFKFEDYFHSTDRPLSFLKFDSEKLNAFADCAIKQNQPYFNCEKFLKAFPYKKTSFKTPLLKWSEIGFLNYGHSLIPPKWSIV